MKPISYYSIFKALSLLFKYIFDYELGLKVNKETLKKT